jgi:hypothetical protein
MAHYAFLDENNIVTEVIPGRHEWEEVDGITDWEQAYSEVRGQVCKRTSYNSNIRGTYAGIGYLYNEEEDIFITPQPYPSWTRSGSFWEPPVPYPTDGLIYQWNEESQDWVAVNHNELE